MLIQEKINAPDTLLKLYVAIDEDLKAVRVSANQYRPFQRGTSPGHFPLFRDRLGGMARRIRIGRHTRAVFIRMRPDTHSG